MSAVAVSLNEAIDALLEAWARWRRAASRLPTGGYRNTLAGLIAEGATVERGSRAQRESQDHLTAIRAHYNARIAALAARVAALAVDPITAGAVIEMKDELARLRKLKSEIPTTVSGLAWASLIHGHGSRPDPDYPEEEAVEVAVCALPPHLKRVVFEEYLRPGTQEMKAKAMEIDRRTYQRRLYAAQQEIRQRLQR